MLRHLKRYLRALAGGKPGGVSARALPAAGSRGAAPPAPQPRGVGIASAGPAWPGVGSARPQATGSSARGSERMGAAPCRPGRVAKKVSGFAGESMAVVPEKPPLPAPGVPFSLSCGGRRAALRRPPARGSLLKERRVGAAAGRMRSGLPRSALPPRRLRGRPRWGGVVPAPPPPSWGPGRRKPGRKDADRVSAEQFELVAL